MLILAALLFYTVAISVPLISVSIPPLIAEIMGAFALFVIVMASAFAIAI